LKGSQGPVPAEKPAKEKGLLDQERKNMLIRNWMQKDPLTIQSDMTASEAVKLFDEHHVSFIPVVDGGKLRGILARRDLREAASCVTATQSIHEVNFFNTRLKVKDLMVRKPITLSIHDTVETALTKGAELGRSFFPVLDGERLVGTVSDRDIFHSLYQILGVEERLYGLTLENDHLGGDAFKKIIELLDMVEGTLYSIFTLKDPETGRKRILLRFKAANLEKVISAFKEKGYRILESVRQG
jgi:acetoin utilization protein AcuB